MLPLAVLSPFLLMPAVVWLGRQPARQASLLGLWPAVLAAYFVFLFQHLAASGPMEASLPWAAALGLTLSFYADGLSLLFAVLITGVGVLIVVFSSRYFDGDPRAGRFQATLFAFMGSMLGVVLANNLLALFVFWELTGFTSFLLIGFNHEQKEARASAVQALLITATGGMGLLAAALLVEQAAGTLQLSALLAGNDQLRQAANYPAIVALILLAAFTKSAQVPFHFWLPGAMTAPSPVSAYLHSATMVKAGVYLVARMTPLAGGTPLWTGLVTGAGAITMVVGAWRAVAETDLKRVLAYSTVSALGVLMMLLGIGTQEAVTAALVYLIAHACYKGALFLIAGTLEHETGTRDVTELGGLRRSMPGVALAGALAAFSMAGFPFFVGFVGKELLYTSLWQHGDWWTNPLLLVAVGASALLAVAGLSAGVSPFFGRAGSATTTHPVPAALVAPSLILAAIGLMVGSWPAAINFPLGFAASSITREAAEMRLALWHGFTPVLAFSILTLGITALLYWVRHSVRKRIWPKALGAHRLYTLPLRGLDAVSAWSIPAMQDASLRSYVLWVVGTAAVLLVVALRSALLLSWPHVMHVQAHEVAAAVLMVAGAFSAVRAKSTITAVLSLGIVGYGVALTYLFFGAPDLAMTQFSVETLTVVIFVLVFYHFRGFGALSPSKERARDALVAVVFGASIAIVLFFVGAAETPTRLADYFVEMGPKAAHGRNIVNVILVDFRALDTLGEITVLATAALGVRAILRLGKGADGQS